MRHWIESQEPEQFEREQVGAEGLEFDTEDCGLSRPEAHAVGQTLLEVYESGRRQLYEHEIYRVLELVGAVTPPRHYFVQQGEKLTAEELNDFPGDKVTLKIVSPDIAHKSDVGGVVFVPKELERVNQEIEQLVRTQGAGGAQG